MPLLQSVPLYLQVVQHIEKAIAEGTWSVDEPLPSEAKLAEYFGVSVGTIRRAMSDLVASEHLIRRHGSGTYVNAFSDAHWWNRFQRFQSADGKLIRWHGEVDFLEELPAPDFVAQALYLSSGSLVWHIRRKMYRSGEDAKPKRCGADDIYLPAALFPNLPEKRFQAGGSVYRFYQQAFGIVICDVTDRLTFGVVTSDSAQALGLTEGDPLLTLTRVGRTFNKTHVEYRVEQCYGGDIQISFN